MIPFISEGERTQERLGRRRSPDDCRRMLLSFLRTSRVPP